jgi:branched-chain amino acid transport system ATP-binding protein
MSSPLLEVEGLNSYYGTAHILHDVSFTMNERPLSIIGRNGMGKSTLCLSIMGMIAKTSGSVRYNGRELLGLPSYKIPREGIAFVPQGRRLFGSLSVDEHLRIVPGAARGRWTPARVYELFPRLAERRRAGATNLSGGEQQMLAIARALLAEPKLLIMDEPSEGLAPNLIAELTDVVRHLEQEGMRLLLVEQKMEVATALSERQLVMLSGAIAAETTSDELQGDPEFQRKFLGVEPWTVETRAATAGEQQ